MKTKQARSFGSITCKIKNMRKNCMNALNQILLEGNVVKSPELKTLPSGALLCTIPIAVNRKFKTSAGETQEEVSYFDVDTFGKIAEVCGKWAPTGRQIRVVGRLKQDRWKNADGKNQSKVKIIAEHVELLRPSKSQVEALESEKKQTAAMLAETANAAAAQQEAQEVTF